MDYLPAKIASFTRLILTLLTGKTYEHQVLINSSASAYQYHSVLYLYHVKKVWPHLKNKFLLTAIAFVVWMLFFDRNDAISQFTYRQQLHKLQSDKEYYVMEIARNKKDMHELMSDLEHMEKFARERYLMKKDNEEIFLILPEHQDEKTAYAE